MLVQPGLSALGGLVCADALLLCHFTAHYLLDYAASSSGLPLQVGNTPGVVILLMVSCWPFLADRLSCQPHH